MVGDTQGALNYYSQALKLCVDFNLPDEASSIHNNVAHLYLEVGKYDVAYKHADYSIRLSQENAEVSLI